MKVSYARRFMEKNRDAPTTMFLIASMQSKVILTRLTKKKNDELFTEVIRMIT